MSARCAVVTGGSQGIGRATAVGLARAGWRVLVTSRSAARGAGAAGEIAAESGGDVDAVAVDLADLDSVRRGAGEIAERLPSLALLVNNAGVVATEFATTPDGIERSLFVNHLGPFLLTHLLLDALRKGAPSRIVNVSSQVHADSLDLAGLGEAEGWDALACYRAAKLANILVAAELARRLEGSGVVAYAVHPGVAWTRLLDDFEGAREPGSESAEPTSTPPAPESSLRRGVRWVVDRVRWRLFPSGVVQPEEAARSVLHVALADHAAPSGAYFHLDAPAAPAAAGRDPALASELWSWSEARVGLR